MSTAFRWEARLEEQAILLRQLHGIPLFDGEQCFLHHSHGVDADRQFLRVAQPEGTPITIYDPITQTCTTSNKCTRTAYPNNTIPTSEISPIAQAMAQYLPAPTNSNITGNLLASNTWGLNNWSQTERIDADLSPKQRISIITGAGRQGLIGTYGTSLPPMRLRFHMRRARFIVLSPKTECSSTPT